MPHLLLSYKRLLLQRIKQPARVNANTPPPAFALDSAPAAASQLIRRARQRQPASQPPLLVRDLAVQLKFPNRMHNIQQVL